MNKTLIDRVAALETAAGTGIIPFQAQPWPSCPSRLLSLLFPAEKRSVIL